MANIPSSEWKWYGNAAHFICGKWCRFHMATEVGPWLISTVGEMVHPSDSGAHERTEEEYLDKNPLGKEVGYGRLFETYVFEITGHCTDGKCGCGLPIFDGCETEGRGSNTRADATRIHREMCEKYAATTPEAR